MQNWWLWILGSLTLAALTALRVCLWSSPAGAADHTDPPEASASPASDIADLYAWHEGGNITVAMTYAGLRMPADGPLYSRDVLYQLHIDDADADANDDVTIEVRFGQDPTGNWGVQFENVPGAPGPIVGVTNGEPLVAANATAWAGLRDDPFFFDFEGLTATFMNAGAPDAATAPTLAFADPPRDTFAGSNAMLVVTEFTEADLMAEASDGGPYRIWASTSVIE
ncbi:MAG: DUF4331 family protein [Myxococcota bacterium]